MKLTLGFSPCPNDTFIFDALVHHKIDTQGLEFEVVLADVEELNQMALRNELHITKLSYHAYAYCLKNYVLLDAGSALGNNCGPLLISKKEYSQHEVSNLKVAIPGKYTTANFLLSLAYPKLTNKHEMLFSDIEKAVLSGEMDAGLIIHENRFTYYERGLKKIIDLGEFWEGAQQQAIPLVGIMIQRNLDENIQQKVNQMLRKSVEFAFQNPESSADFVQLHAQEMDADVRKKHIGLYVNDYSIDLGKKGRAAVQRLFDVAWQAGVIPESKEKLFL